MEWTQEFGVTKSMEELSSPMNTTRPALMEKKATRPHQNQPINCPRCHSTNTKFCYYNNYSLTQPRYFCKTCRRYWTEGGTLRNVPVGGGSRKHKKPVSTPSFTTDQFPFSSQKLAPHFPPHHQNPKILDQGQDLNLGFQGPRDYSHGMPQFLEYPKMENKSIPSSSSLSGPLSALSLLGNGNVPMREMNSFFPNVARDGALDKSNGNALFGPGFLFQECKPSLGFSVDGIVNGRGCSSSKSPVEDNGNGTLMFMSGETKRGSTPSDGGDHPNGDKASNANNSNLFWNGMLGGGSW